MELEDLGTWDRLLSEVTKSLARNNIPEDKRQIIYAGYEEIKNELGEDVLKKSSNSLIPSLYNFAPWSLLRNAVFGHKLTAIKGKKNFEYIRQRLIMNNFENSFGAEAEIEVAGDIIKAGFCVELIKPETKKVKPDFKAECGNSWIYFEVTTFRTWSDKSIQTQRYQFEVMTRLNQVCRANERFVEVDFNGMSAEVALAYTELIKSKIMVMFQTSEESEIAFNGIRLHCSKREEGYGIPYIHGLSFSIDEMFAISRKMTEKIEKKQLPSDEYGILLVFTRTPYLPDFKALADKLKEDIKTDSDLDAAVIVYISHEQIAIPLSNEYFKVIRGASYDGLFNHYYIIILQNKEDKKLIECLNSFIESPAGCGKY
jgi:hypothetical protein